jgi:hypothetical protein
VDPDYTDVNAILDVLVTADHADGVRMELENGDVVELTPLGAGEFGGEILAYSGLSNGQMTAWFTPWRDALVGETVGAEYVIALPPPGYELYWNADDLDVDGNVAAIGVLPDGRPVEFGTYHVMGEPRCYLRLRDKSGEPVEFVDVLPPAHCRAIDFKIDRTTGVMHLLLERKKGDDLVWWAGESPGWGLGPKNIGIGEVGDTALALASRPGLVAVCGAKPVATTDKRDALAVLLRPGQQAEERLFDYENPNKHWFAETARDCIFSGDTLVLVGEANGKHDGGNWPDPRDRRMVIEHDVAADVPPKWTVGGTGPGVQSRILAVDVDDQGRYHTVGYTCLDVCEPEGEVRVYSPGGELESQVPMGPLGSAWFGPHDIAWSPAGYAVVAWPSSRASPPCSKCRRSRRTPTSRCGPSPERQAGDPDRVRRGGRPLRRGLRRRDRRHEPPRVRGHRRLDAEGFSPAGARTRRTRSRRGSRPRRTPGRSRAPRRRRGDGT